MTRPGVSMFNTPDGHDQMTDDIQELVPWIKENKANAAKLWCAFSNIQWKKGEAIFTVSFRGAGAYVGELFMGTEEYLKDDTNYMEFYCSGQDGAVDPKIFEYLKEKGWTPYRYSRGNFTDPSSSLGDEITTPVEPILAEHWRES